MKRMLCLLSISGLLATNASTLAAPGPQATDLADVLRSLDQTPEAGDINRTANGLPLAIVGFERYWRLSSRPALDVVVIEMLNAGKLLTFAEHGKLVNQRKIGEPLAVTALSLSADARVILLQSKGERGTGLYSEWFEIMAITPKGTTLLWSREAVAWDDVTEPSKPRSISAFVRRAAGTECGSAGACIVYYRRSRIGTTITSDESYWALRGGRLIEVSRKHGPSF
jgi:hypothetical protein